MHEGDILNAIAMLPHGGAAGIALVLAMLTAGLVGGVTHCVGMCGPFVLAQTTARLETVPAARMTEFHRLAGAALVPYQLGRITSYVVLGAVAGAVGGALGLLPGFNWVAAGWLSLAAVVFLSYGVTGHFRFGGDAAKTGLGKLLAETVRPLFARPVGWRGYGLGIALGFLPCGLLYAALIVAAGSGGAWGGAIAMGAFVVGTVPGLVMTGLAGHVAAGRWRRVTTTVAPALMIVNAGVLAYAAWRLVA